MSYDQLAGCFPTAKPSTFPPMANPCRATKRLGPSSRRRGDSFSYPTATEIKSKGFFAWLFGGGDDEEDTAAARDTGSRGRQTRVASTDRNVPVSAGPAMLYGNHDDAGVREFNLGASASSVPSMAPAPTPVLQRRPPTPAPVQQAALEPVLPVQQAASDPAPANDSEAEQTLARAMSDRSQSATASLGSPGAAPMQLAGTLQARSAPTPTTVSAPMPPVRPVELASEGPRAPLPPNRPAELVAALGPKSDRAPGVNASQKDAIGALMASRAACSNSEPAERDHARVRWRKAGLLTTRHGLCQCSRANAGAGIVGSAAGGEALQFVAARLDRSNFRSLTASGPAARAVVHSGLGSAVSALRPAAQAALGTMTGTASPAAQGFGSSATELPPTTSRGPSRNPAFTSARLRPQADDGVHLADALLTMNIPALFDLSGRVALVTGSSRGIGLAIARGLAQAGALVVLNGRNRELLDAAHAALAAEGLRVAAKAFDAAHRTQVDDAVAAIEAEHGPIEILVNNAGIQRRGAFESFPTEIWQEIFDTNVHGVFHVTQAVGKRMVERRRGRIIIICSVTSELAVPRSSHMRPRRAPSA